MGWWPMTDNESETDGPAVERLHEHDEAEQLCKEMLEEIKRGDTDDLAQAYEACDVLKGLLDTVLEEHFEMQEYAMENGGGDL